MVPSSSVSRSVRSGGLALTEAMEDKMAGSSSSVFISSPNTGPLPQKVLPVELTHLYLGPLLPQEPITPTLVSQSLYHKLWLTRARAKEKGVLHMENYMVGCPVERDPNGRRQPVSHRKRPQREVTVGIPQKGTPTEDDSGHPTEGTLEGEKPI